MSGIDGSCWDAYRLSVQRSDLPPVKRPNRARQETADARQDYRPPTCTRLSGGRPPFRVAPPPVAARPAARTARRARGPRGAGRPARRARGPGRPDEPAPGLAARLPGRAVPALGHADLPRFHQLLRLGERRDERRLDAGLLDR